MNHDSTTILEWTYEPLDFFEEPMDVEILSDSVHMEGGKVRGDFTKAESQMGSKFKNQAHAELERLFASQQIATGKKLRLSGAILIHELPDGIRVVYTSANMTGRATLTGRIEAITRDKDGNIISETRADRLEEQRKFREKVARCIADFPEPGQNILAMQACLQKSFDDEINCFLYLYEIRDRLETIFGNQRKAKRFLGETDWRKLGELANDPTSAASRHRGRATDHRPPSPSTLREGREAARHLIVAYVDHLCRS